MFICRSQIACVLAAVVLASPIGARLSAAGLRITSDASSVSIFDGDRPVLHYRYTDVPMKPYADRLYSPAGVQVLCDSPADHKHHHGLMYALSVDGVNFWEENRANSGKEIGKSLSDVKTTVGGDVTRAGFVQQIDWSAPSSMKPLLIERRAIDAVKADGLGATLLAWRCRLQTPPGKDSVVLAGSDYFGLGMRFVSSMDSGGCFFIAGGKVGEVLRGGERLTATKWCAYTAQADGHPVSVAVFDNPANPRFPATMFTLTKPFAYLSATLNQSKEPLAVKADKPLDLCYGVALWDGEVDQATVEKLYQRWLKLAKP